MTIDIFTKDLSVDLFKKHGYKFNCKGRYYNNRQSDVYESDIEKEQTAETTTISLEARKTYKNCLS